jgi:hypothetical protein
VVGGQRDNDARAVAHRVEGIEESAERAVDPQDLVTDLARVGTIGVTDGIGRRQADGQHVRLRPEAELERGDAFERELEGDFVHRGEGVE